MTGDANDLARRLAMARQGRPEALGEALEACRGYLLLIASRELEPDLLPKAGASDVVQDTFLEAQRDFGRFQGHTGDEFRAWLRQMLLNNLANFRRRYRQTAKRRVGREVRLPAAAESGVSGEGLVADVLSPSGEAVANEQAEAVGRALDRLPADYRRVLLLRYQEQQTFEAIGRALGRTPNAARLLWLRAVERLHEELQGGR
jgi:RNA polymerase sigma-70 factor (ECF subfamily)